MLATEDIGLQAVQTYAPRRPIFEGPYAHATVRHGGSYTPVGRVFAHPNTAIDEGEVLSLKVIPPDASGDKNAPELVLSFEITDTATEWYGTKEPKKGVSAGNGHKIIRLFGYVYLDGHKRYAVMSRFVSYNDATILCLLS